MKIVTKTEVSLTFSDLEKILREKNVIPEDLILVDIINMTEKKEIQLLFNKEVENAGISKSSILVLNKEVFLETPLSEIGLSNRNYNIFCAAKIETTEQLLGWTEYHLRQLKNFGEKSIRELEKILMKYGLEIKTEDS